MVGLRPGKALVQEKPPLVSYIATAAAAVGLSSPARITCGDSMVGRAAGSHMVMCNALHVLGGWQSAALAFAERRAGGAGSAGGCGTGRCAMLRRRNHRSPSTSTTTARDRSDLGCSFTAPPGSVEGIKRQVPRLLFCRVGPCDQDRPATPLCSRLPPEAECLVTARAGQARRSAGSSPLVSPQPPSAPPS